MRVDNEMSNHEKEVLEIGFSENFTKEEIKEIIETFSTIVRSEPRYYVKLSAEELPAELIFILGCIFGSVASGFFQFNGFRPLPKGKRESYKNTQK